MLRPVGRGRVDDAARDEPRTRPVPSRSSRRSTPKSPRHAVEVVDLILAESRAGRGERRPPPADARRAGDAMAGRRRPPGRSAAARRGRRPNVVARLKVLAELLTYRTDVPQEGRIRGTTRRGRGPRQHVPDPARREGRRPPLRRARAASSGSATSGLPDEVREALGAAARRDLGRDRPLRAGGDRQDDHDLRLPPRAGRVDRRAGGAWRRWKTRSRWPSPGVSQSQVNLAAGFDLADRPPLAPAAGPRGHRRRRDPRPADGRGRRSRRR